MLNLDAPPGANVFFISDTHFFHEGVVESKGRPFSSLEEMHETLVRNWNARVGAEDWVFHLGDFCWRARAEATAALLPRLNGRIFLIRGNHDAFDAEALQQRAEKPFEAIADLAELRVSRPDGAVAQFVLCHYPIENRRWKDAKRGALHLHGHDHRHIPVSGEGRFCMSVEGWNYCPAKAGEVLRLAPA